MRFNKERFWKIVDRMQDPVLAFISIFFVIGVLQDYISEKTDFAIEEVPIQEHPTMTLTFGHPLSLNRFFFNLSEIDIFYYKSTNDESRLSVLLKLGDNHLDDKEIIHLRKGELSYSISVKPTTTFHHDKSERRFVKIVFRPYFWTANWWTWWSLYVFFNNDDESYGAESFKFYDGALNVHGNKAILRPLTYDLIYLKPTMRKLLKEKNQCRDESFFKLFQHDFVKYVKEICGADACRPTELPDNPIRECLNDKEFTCARKVMTESLEKSEYHKSVRCSRIEYEAVQKGQRSTADLITHGDHIKVRSKNKNSMNSYT